MQYLLLIYDQEERWTKLSDAQSNSDLQEYEAFGKEFAKKIRGGNALQPTPTAKTVRVRNGATQVTDGPFAETKEQLGGYYLIEAKDLNDAIQVASKIPSAKTGSIGLRSGKYLGRKTRQAPAARMAFRTALAL